MRILTRWCARISRGCRSAISGRTARLDTRSRTESGIHSAQAALCNDPPSQRPAGRHSAPSLCPSRCPADNRLALRGRRGREVLRVCEGYAELTPGSLVVPADEVQGIFHVAAAAEQTSPLRLVFVPDRILCLRITLGRRRTAERYEPEPLARRPGIAPITRFVAHERHLHVDRCSPAACGLPSIVIPVGVLLEHLADIRLSCRRRCGATAGERYQCGQQHRRNQFWGIPDPCPQVGKPERQSR